MRKAILVVLMTFVMMACGGQTLVKQQKPVSVPSPTTHSTTTARSGGKPITGL